MRAVCLVWALSLALSSLPALLLQAGAQEALRCRVGLAPCKDGSDCVPFSHLCDGEKDCPDGSDEADCSSGCGPGQVQCADGVTCIERTELCDGVSQCQDRSDEEDCVTPDEGCVHRCDKTLCLSESLICNGESDCDDGSDEADCDFKSGVEETPLTMEGETILPTIQPERKSAESPALYCRLGSKPCKDGSECVLFNHVCDGENDCKDGSDEEDCFLECKAGQFQCAHGKKCIEKRQLCDGVAQCQDRSDEEDCFNPDEGCSHRCDKTRCLSDQFVCDGDPDCEDGSDEANCEEGSCGSSEFQCGTGQCVSISVLCDGHPDCKDHSDEVSCEKWVECVAGQWRCPESHECVLQEWICDGENDCKDASDEQNCTDAAVHCGEFQWQCASQTQCVPQSWRCDGEKDCRDESDEAGCEAVPCPPHQFQCGSLECLDPSLLCNGASDCQDGSDEGGTCTSDKCTDQSECAQDCHSTPTGTRCWCREGYEPVNGGLECADVDECMRTARACAHTCTNTDGSFRCSCNHGYVLEPDGRGCKITGEAYLLASVQTNFFLLGIRTSSLDVLLSYERQPILSLDYDWKEQRVYWVNVELDGIRWITLDQKDMGTLIQGARAECVAVDWLGRSLYWTDRAKGRINAVRLDGLGMEPVIIVNDVKEPRSLVLIPQKGVMMWSVTGAEALIERAGMDGSDRRVLVSGALRWPMGLAVDPLQDRIYWTDEKLHCIGSATLDGDDVKILQMMETPSPFSLVVFGDMVYWSDTTRRTIQSARKLTGKQRKVLLKRPGQPLGLKVIHALLQPSLENPCAQKQCSHQCTLAPGLTGVCKCPSGLPLDEDGLMCSKPEGSTFLLLLSPTEISQVSIQSRFAGVGVSDWPERQRIAIPDVTQASALDLVLSKRALYVWDGSESALVIFKLKEAVLARRGTLFGLRKGSVTAMAMDYITMGMFWSSTDQSGIYVTSEDGKHTSLVLYEGVATVRSIAVHPPTGRLCFSNAELQGKSALLECAYMNGESRSVVWDQAVDPVSLSLSKDGSRLYWADTGLGLISSVGLDSSGFKSIKTEKPVVSFTLANNLLFWLTKSGSTKCWFSEDLQKATLWFEVRAEVLDLKAFSEQSQKGSNSCSNGNGGCSQLCLAFPGGRTCRCGRGFLLVNETLCAPDPRCPADTVPCLRGDECLPWGMFCDSSVDCQDGTDEICVHGVSEGPKPVDPKPVDTKPKPSPSPKRPSLVPKSRRPVSTGLPDERLTNPSIVPDPKSSDAEDVKVESVDAASCGARLCHGNGECVVQDGKTICQCVAGYGGEHCEDQDGGLFQGPVLYGVVGLAVAVIVLGAVVGIVKKKKAGNQRQSRPIVRDTSMNDLGKGVESAPQQNKDPESPEV